MQLCLTANKLIIQLQKQIGMSFIKKKNSRRIELK